MADGLGWLGLARRGGNLALGEENTRAALRLGKARLVLVASDASEGARRRAEGYVFEPGVPLTVAPYTKEQIADMVGKTGCSMAAFLDTGLAAAFLAALREEFGEEYGPLAEAFQERLRRRSKSGNAGKRRKRA